MSIKITWIILLTLCMLFWFGIYKLCFGYDIPQDMWKGIIAEAVSEGYSGMYAVACVYRNRLDKGMSLGCVALNRKDLNEFVKNQKKKYEIIAKRIIKQVFEDNHADITGGATHYESTDFPTPYWAKDMEITCRIGKHIFYKEIK